MLQQLSLSAVDRQAARGLCLLLNLGVVVPAQWTCRHGAQPRAGPLAMTTLLLIIVSG